ncbi:GNAT family N-acetyltransferase [Parvibaculum sp.]|uniref:GNAT family N-acetyltransferase n=1 Tax=Parvibaculum sp. TaxID=2024848 RepID=UPI003296B0AD
MARRVETMEAFSLFQDMFVLDQLVYAAGAAVARGQPLAPAGLTVSSFSGDSIDGLVPEWRALELRTPHAATAFQSCDLLLHWARHFTNKRNELRVVAVRERGELVLVWPLAVEKTPFGRVACWAGDPVGQYGDVVAAEGGARDAWIETAFAETGNWGDVDFLCLRGVRADGAIAGWAANKGRPLGASAEAPVCDTSSFADAKSFADARWPALKHNKRRWKKLATLGDIHFEVLGPGDRAAELVARGFAFKREWLATRGLYGRALIDRRTEDCLAALARDTSASSGMTVSHLSVGGETAAVEIGFRRCGRHYAYMGTFSSAFAKQGPGNLATELTIRDCIEQGLCEYDPLPPAVDYKLAWSNARVPVHDYGVVLTWSGYAALASVAFIRPAAKSLYEKLPLTVRRRLRK